MRKGIIVTVNAADGAHLEAVVAKRNSQKKHTWLTADGLGTAAIMPRTGKSKSVVWPWRERFMQAGVDSLLPDKTRPPIPPLGQPVVDRADKLRKIVGLYVDPPDEKSQIQALDGGSVTRRLRNRCLNR